MKIAEIYHEYDGVPEYRMIKNLLERQDIFISNATAHKYMNIDLGLFSVLLQFCLTRTILCYSGYYSGLHTCNKAHKRI